VPANIPLPGKPVQPNQGTAMTESLPLRLSDEGRTATWNPALTRASSVVLQVRRGDGEVEKRITLNSGRARVRAPEAIESVFPLEE